MQLHEIQQDQTQTAAYTHIRHVIIRYVASRADKLSTYGRRLRRHSLYVCHVRRVLTAILHIA